MIRKVFGSNFFDDFKLHAHKIASHRSLRKVNVATHDVSQLVNGALDCEISQVILALVDLDTDWERSKTIGNIKLETVS